MKTPRNHGPSRRRQSQTQPLHEIVLKKPAQLDTTDLPLGWSLDPAPQVGFAKKARRSTAPQIAAYTGDGHAMVVARTGAGKGRSCALPWLLHHDSAAIVLDVKGEAYQCTADYRKNVLGHRVYALDPFGLVGGTDTLNPFDLVRKDMVDVDADVIAELIVDGKPPSKVDQFWDNMARAFLLGCIAHIATSEEAPNLIMLRDLLQGDDVPLAIATLLDQKKVTSALARREFATYCNHEGDKVRTSVLSTAQQHLRILGAERVARSLCASTLSLDDVMRGEKVTVYLVIPPENLASHGAVLRLWIGTLLNVMTRRKQLPKCNTLFLLDEIGQVGRLPALRQAITLLRGYAVTTVTLWQDLAQLQAAYEDWRSILNNCAVVQTFGAANFEMATAMANILGVTPQRLMSLPPDHAITYVVGNEPREVRRLDYLNDRWLRGRATANPRFAQRGVAPDLS